MKTALLFSLLLLSLPTFAITFDCQGPGIQLSIDSRSPRDIRVYLRGEAAQAEGIATPTQIDIVARFPMTGEMTLFARVGLAAQENYVFIRGQRLNIFCR